MNAKIIDTRGMRCPLPTLRANKALRGALAGETIEILATDPMAKRDIRTLCEETGNNWLGCEELDGVATIRIRKV